MPEYIPGRIVDREHVICPDNRYRKWYPAKRDPMGYEKLFGLEYGRVNLAGNISVRGWRKDSDKRLIMETSSVPERFVARLPKYEMWTGSQKSQEQLQVLAKAHREKMQAVKEYEAIKPIDINNTLTPPDYSFQDKDPLPLPY